VIEIKHVYQGAVSAVVDAAIVSKIHEPDQVLLEVNMGQISAIRIGDTIEISSSDPLEDYVVERIDHRNNNTGVLYARKKAALEKMVEKVIPKEKLIEDDMDIWFELNQ